MKKGLLQMIAITVLALTANLTMAQTYTYPVEGKQGFNLTSQTRDGVHITYELGQFTLNPLDYRGETMSEIDIAAIVLPNEAGSPNLPTESRTVAIPQGSQAKLNIINYQTQTIKNVNIAPALRIQDENEEPDMNYVKDMKVYNKDAFYPENPFELATTSIRGVDAVAVSITPFQYNPVTKDLRVYTDIEFSVTFEGGNGHFGDDAYRSPYWDPILASELMNYDQLPVIDYEARMQQWLRDGEDGAEYLIIIPNNDGWTAPAQRLKEYRTKQGIITEVYRLDQIPATSTSQMKTWFHNAYNNWTIKPVAVLLFADHKTDMTQGIPAEEIYHSSSYGNCITDNQYADVTGDLLPEMVFSRLIAANPTEAAMMADKQIEYEFTNPNMNANSYNVPITALGWQNERWFQLCSEVVGGYFRAHGKNPYRVNCIYSGSPGSSWSSAQNTAQVVSYFGPQGTNYIPQTPDQLGGFSGGTPEQIVQAINSGTMLVQHRDHGLEEGWGEPAFRNSHVAQLTNVGKMTFVMSINCLTGQFDLSPGPCFAEAFMRHTYNGQNAGAVGMICPTDVSYSFVNDALVWGIYDHFLPDFMPTYGPYAAREGNWLPAFGLVAGKYFLAQSSWPYNNNSKAITYQMFTAHCDAFLRLYSEVPQAMTVNHMDVQLAGMTEFQITAPEGATIALTKGEGENLQIVAVAQATGSVQVITIPAQTPPTILNLTVTGQNYLRYNASIEVIPADGPYLIINNYELANEATQLNFGDEGSFDLTLKNVGNSQAPAGTATLSSESEYVTVNSNSIEFGAIASNAILDINNAFDFTISDEVPNKTVIDFLVTITSGNDSYENHINVRAYAPVFEIGDVTIQEVTGNGNGRLDPGELVNLIFPVWNKGNTDSHEADVTLTLNNNFMQILGDATQTVSSVASDAAANMSFQVYVGSAPSGFAAEYTLDVVSGVYTDTRSYISKIGLNVEDFEMGVLDPTLWTNNSAIPWTFCTESPYEGNVCMKSGAIGHSSETVLNLQYEVGEADSISFYYKVSSEGNYDKLFFLIDGQEKNNWSGTVNWSRAQYYVTAGTHTLTWKYKKDTSVSNGSDCAWIDYVVLPRDRSMTASAGLDMDICEHETAHILGYATNYQSLAWTTSGDGTFDDATIAEPIYTPGTQDIDNGSVTLTLTATSSTNSTITDEMTLAIFRAISIENALTDQYYCAVSEPQPVAVTVTGDYTKFTWTTEGDGTFENTATLETYYTPGPQDIANRHALLHANAASPCGEPYAYELTLEELPQMILENTTLEICEGENATMNFTLSGSVQHTAGMPEYVVTINGVAYEDFHTGDNTLDLGLLEPGETVFNINSVENQLCGVTYNEGEFFFTINTKAAPSVEVSEVPFSICAGEEVNIEFTFAGEAPFTVEGIGFESFTTDDESYILTFMPTETMEITLDRVIGGNGCETAIGQVITLNVNTVPEVSISEVPEVICQGETLDIEFTFVGDAPFTVEGTGFEAFTAESNSYTLTLTPTEDVELTLEKVVSENGCETLLDQTIAVNVKTAPTLNISEVPFSICKGEEVSIEFTFTGTAPFTVESTGTDSFTTDDESYTMTFTPDEDVNIMLVSVSDAEGCEVSLDQFIGIAVYEVSEVPAISGDQALDVRLTPISTYTIANDVMVRYTLEPENAGTITGDYDDGMTIDIEWSNTFKGEAVLTAIPVSECNNGEASMTILVKNTTDVNEWADNAKIYPNPTSEKVRIEAEGMTHIDIYNTVGQMVYHANVNNDMVSIDMTSFPAGSYTVKISTNRGVCVKHLNVIR